MTPSTPLPPSPLYPHDSGRPRLRVTVVLACHALPGWLDETLAALETAPFVELALLRSPPAPARRQGSLLWRCLYRGDRALLGSLSSVLAPRPLRPSLAAAPLYDDGALTRAVATTTPDVLLCLGRSPAPVALWPLARRAAWSLPAEACHADGALLHLLPAFLRGEAGTVSGLPIHDDRAGQHLLLEPTDVSVAQLSLARNSAYQLQKAPAQLLRALRHLHRDEPLEALPVSVPRPPGRLASLRLCLALALRGLRRRLPRLGRIERWTLAFRRNGHPLRPEAPDAHGFRCWTPPAGWFWADPFPWSRGGEDLVFFEALPYASGVGEIHMARIDADGQPSAPVAVIADGRHRSYPFLVEHGGEPLMLVECAESRRLEAWRPERWPDRWRAVATLLEGWRIVDATLHRHAGRWWLFACVAETPFDDGGREFNELFLFHADDPLGPWQPHPDNPVVRGVARARPAGPLFEHGGRLIRPAQDCTLEYGHRIVFHEVLRLDETAYEERPLGRLDPVWAPGLRGCHTYARHGRLEFLDAKFLVPSRAARGAVPRAPGAP
ncbi:glucosamine inositolphosphorylceramide transferase family protein [Silanimonas lenta]|uniref:glucosamine inositolphosphorylceramide transferase family protein n=1 Tax=Silanimonas lenta TaxID=265429 RepID=UPI002FE3156C